MTAHKVKPTVPEVLPLVNAYMAKPGNSNGGSLHVVLCDPNYEDGHVQGCLEFAHERGDRDGVILAGLMLRMSRTQRARLAELKTYPEADPRV